jgi:hypothetical protein
MKLYLFSIRDGDSFVGMSSPSHHLTLLWFSSRYGHHIRTLNGV